LSQVVEMDASDCVVISDELVGLSEVIQFKKRCKVEHFFYVISSREDDQNARSIQAACKAQDIRVIPPFRSVEQIGMDIYKHLFNSSSGTSKVVAAMAAVYGVGLTSSLLLLGKQLTEVSNIKVGIIGLNGFNHGTTLIDYKGKYLDEVWGMIDSQVLLQNDLISKMHLISPNLYYLAGNRDLLKVYTYTPEGISYLIDMAKGSFDLVILDVGCYIDTALAFQGILSSDLLLVQTNQDRFAKDNWLRQKEQILSREIGIDFSVAKNIWLTCNKMFKTPDVETDSQLQDDYGLPGIASLPYINSFYQLQNRQNLLNLSDKNYIKETNRIADALIDYYEFPLKIIETRKKVKSGLFAWGNK